MLLAPSPVFFHISGIGYHHVLFFFVTIEEEIVYNPPFFCGETAVLYLTYSKFGSIVARYFLEECQSIGTFYPKLAHVRNVEYPHVIHNIKVFFDNAIVLDRHIIAGKFCHLGTECNVQVGKWSRLHTYDIVSNLFLS